MCRSIKRLRARRLIAVALASLLAASCGGGEPTATTASATPTPRTPAPPDFGIQEWSGEPKGSNLCGDYSVLWQSPDLGGGGNSATLTAVSGKDVVLDIKAKDEHSQIMGMWCGDVTGDERLELASQTFTGGAHCCWTFRIDTLDGPTLLDADLGNYGDLEPKQLDDGGAYELIGFSDALAYFEELPYAVTQSLPRVFAFKKDHFVNATTDFPAQVRKSLDGAREDLDQAVAEGADSQVLEGLAIGLYGHYVLLDQAESGLDDTVAGLPDEAAQWVRDHAEAAVALIRGES